jgi:hypothetical protein
MSKLNRWFGSVGLATGMAVFGVLSAGVGAAAAAPTTAKIVVPVTVQAVPALASDPCSGGGFSSSWGSRQPLPHAWWRSQRSEKPARLIGQVHIAVIKSG